MSLSFDQLRWPLAIALVLIVAFILFPRAGDEMVADATPRPSVVLGDVGGAIVTAEPQPSEVAATPIPTVSPPPSAEATPEPTDEPTATPAPQADGFSAEVLACRSISGSACNDQLGTLPSGAATFTALVRFTDANAGDEMNAILDGPSGTLPGFPYNLQGGGDGYYYSQFQAGGLPSGDYTLTAIRNGEPVAVTSFTKAG